MLRDAACFICPLSGRVRCRRESRLGSGWPEARWMVPVVPSFAEARPVVLGGLSQGCHRAPAGAAASSPPSSGGERVWRNSVLWERGADRERVKRAISHCGSSPACLVRVFLVSPCVKEELVSPVTPCVLDSQRVLCAGRDVSLPSSRSPREPEWALGMGFECQQRLRVGSLSTKPHALDCFCAQRDKLPHNEPV